jgi:hypothetical protein
MYSDDSDPVLVCIATTEDKANAMIETAKSVFEDAFEYDIYPMKTNTTTINDKEITF